MNIFWRHRYTILALMVSGSILSFLDRIAMSSCLPFIAKEFDLNSVQQGMVLSAFFLSYALMQIPGGMMVDKFGSKKIMLLAILWWSAFTAMTGLASGLSSMLVIRFLFGLGEAAYIPTVWKTAASWFPKKEIGNAGGWLMAANGIGSMLAPLFVAGFVTLLGWRHVFIALVIPGLLMALLLTIFVQNSPNENKRISLKERAESPAPSAHPDKKSALSILEALQSPLVWPLFVTLFFFNIAQWGLVTWMPTYLLDAQGFSLKEMGIGASLPFLTGTLGYLVSGYASDNFLQGQRYLLVVIGEVGGAVFLFLMMFIPASGVAVISTLCAATFFMSIGQAAIFTLPAALLPHSMVGSATGFINTAGQIAGVVSPFLVGTILQYSGKNFSLVFALFFSCLLIAAPIAFLIKRSPGKVEVAAQNRKAG